MPGNVAVQDNDQLGAAKVSSLVATAGSFVGAEVGSVFSTPRVVGKLISFVRATIKFPFNRKPCPAIIFLICSDLESMASGEDFPSVHRGLTSDFGMFEADLVGRVILISQNGSAGAISARDFPSFKEQLNFVASKFDTSAELIIFHLETPRYEVWGNGVAGGASEETRMSISDGILEGDNLTHRLDEFDRDWVNGQTGFNRLWSAASAYVPCESAEKEIQSHLHCWLQAADARAVTISEVNNQAGRADLWIRYKHDEAQRSAILELKVLREKYYNKDAKNATKVAPSTNIEAAKSAVKQALSYRDRLGASRALACIFDMRKPPSDKKPVDEASALAKAYDVVLRTKQVNNAVSIGRDAALNGA